MPDHDASPGPTLDLPGITVTAATIDPIPDDVALVIDGNEFLGWQEVRVTRGVERMPSDFSLTVTERFAGMATDIKIGAPCRLVIEGDLVLTGYVDRYEPSIDPVGHRVVVYGRGKCADLVDCAAIFEDGAGKELTTQLSAVSARALVEKLAKPYGITVTALDGDGPQIPQFNALLTETPFEIIDRVTRFARLLAYDDENGNLVLAQAGTRSMATGFQQGVNVERASVTFAMDQRYSEIQALLMPVNLLGDMTEAVGGNTGWNIVHTERDLEVPRRRRRVIIVEQMWGGEELARQRAAWEVARRYGRGKVVTLTTDSWRDGAGSLWQPNTKVSVDLPALKIAEQTMVIAEVTFRRGMDGTHADLVLMPEQAFQPEPITLLPTDTQVWKAIREATQAPNGDSR